MHLHLMEVKMTRRSRILRPLNGFQRQEAAQQAKVGRGPQHASAYDPSSLVVSCEGAEVLGNPVRLVAMSLSSTPFDQLE